MFFTRYFMHSSLTFDESECCPGSQFCSPDPNPLICGLPQPQPTQTTHAILVCH